MEQKETFKLTYSARQQEEIRSIRKKYLPPEADKMAQLRALDAAVTRKAAMVSILIGVIGTLILGIGMSLLLSDFGSLLGAQALPIGVGIGAAGIALLSCAYPLHQHTLKQERRKIAPEILRLTEDLMQ